MQSIIAKSRGKNPKEKEEVRPPSQESNDMLESVDMETDRGDSEPLAPILVEGSNQIGKCVGRLKQNPALVIGGLSRF